MAKGRLVLNHDAERVEPRNIAMCYHCDDAWQAFGTPCIDREDPCVRQAGTQNAPDQHVLCPMVGQIGEAPRDLLWTIGASMPARRLV